VSTSTIAKGSRVEQAFHRLESAIDRLDGALTARSSVAGAGENTEALELLRQENAALKDLNRAAADRLADTIKRLDSLLHN